LVDDKEWQKFITECTVYKEKVDNLTIITKEQEKRISVLETENTKTDFQYNEIMKTLNKLVETTIPALSAEIQAIKEKPVKRYETVVAGVLGALAGGIGTFIVNMLFK
jgi:CII-binding regulator of phage lambda lysogenization HflD